MAKLNKFISAAAAALIAVMQIPAFAAFADVEEDVGRESLEDTLTDGTFTFEHVEGGYKIIACDGSAIISEIPAMRNGYAIVEIGESAFAGCAFIEGLEIPDTVRAIGEYAFAGCSAAKTLVIPDTVTEIPTGAFSGCSSLTEIIIPEGVETVGTGAFASCSSVTNVELPESLTTIGPSAFEACGALTEFNIPANVAEIGEFALTNCYSLETITADGNSSFVVEDNVLYNTSKTTLHRAAVAGIDKEFYVPETVTTIMGGAFSYCTELEKVFVTSEKLTEIGTEAFFFCTGLSHIELPNSLVTIKSSAFAHCTALTDIELPVNLKTIGEGAFFDAASLEKVIMQEGLETIEAGAFAVCDSLKNVVVPKSVETVGEYALGYTFNADGSDYEKLSGFTMSVNSGSAAQDYAEDNDIEHTVVDKSLKDFAFIIICVGVLAAAAVFAVVLMRRGKKGASAEVRAAEKAEAEALEENDPSYEGIVEAEPETDDK
ncbi:MAG: leucine-rich repeat domain-containing protein [Ruminococcus sp.]|nr:leucine-rich repeat domain-containing protein [Ruminococcus sp.]